MSLRRRRLPRGCCRSRWIPFICFPLVMLLCPILAGPAFASTAPGASANVADVVSGTNCSASGSFTAAHGTYVTNVRLFIGGELVKSYTYGVDDSVKKESRTLAVTWASTQFFHNTSQPVRVWGKDAVGNEREDTKQTSIYNRAYILANDQDVIGSLPFGQRARGHVEAYASIMNHGCRSSSVDLKGAILNGVSEETVFFIWTHGAPGYFGDCAATPAWDPDHYIVWTTLRAANDKTNYPPYNFVHLFACNCASDAYLAVAFGVMSEGGGVISDRALLGFKSDVFMSARNEEWLRKIWAWMADGWTAGQALWIVESNQRADKAVDLDGLAEPLVKGDLQTRLMTVYGGDRTQWYR